jgi:hypothetical protein
MPIQSDLRLRLRHIKNLLQTADFRKMAEDQGKIHAPRLTEYMTKPEEPGFQIWAERFIILITVVFILIDGLQFIDIFSPNLKLIMIFHFVRIFIIVGVLITAFISIDKGWRTGNISIIFQLVVMVVTLLISIGAAISKAILLSRTQNKTMSRYFSVIFPFVQILISIYGIIVMFTEYMSGITHAPISMITLILLLFISFGMSIIQLYNVYYQLQTNKKSATDFVNAGDTSETDSNQPNTIINPVDQLT